GGGRDGRPARALLLAARMDLGRLIRFIKERETSVEEVKRYVARLRRGAEQETVAIGHGELGDRDRVLLSIAERAGAVELAPGGREGLRGWSRRAGRAGGSGRRSAEPPEAAVDAEEFERLRAWRWERAQGKPAYTVAANAVLEEVLRRRPANMRQLVEVRGIGRSFCEKHGESMLAAVRELDERPAPIG